jgi:hypothetical protein
MRQPKHGPPFPTEGGDGTFVPKAGRYGEYKSTGDAAKVAPELKHCDILASTRKTHGVVTAAYWLADVNAGT